MIAYFFCIKFKFNIMELFYKMKKGFFLMSLCFACLAQVVAQNVAEVSGVQYPTLQAAVTAAYELDGAVTIELLTNTSEVVVVCQQPEQQLTINGHDNTLTGQIIINYGRNATDNTAATSITNMNFVYDENYYNTSAGKYLIALPANAAYNRCDPSYTGSYNSSHNITVSNCTFDGGGSSNGVAAFHVGSAANGIPNITLDHLTVANAHSLVQIQGGVNGLTITNCKAVSDVKNGINITGGVGTITITNDTITTLTGGDQYALRLKGNSTGAREAVLSGNQFIAPRAFEITNTSAGTTLSISSGRYEGTIYRTGTDVSEFSFTGGTFDQDAVTVQEYCAYGYAAVANDPDDEHCTVRKLEIARIGTTIYPSLQDAVTAAYEMDGAVTIELLKNTTENVVVCQQRGLKLTIDGSSDTLTGQIVVNGINVTTTGGGDISASSLDIVNLNFKNSPDMWTSYFVDVPTNSTSASWHVCDPSRTNGYNDAHNVTVKNCTFDGGGSSNGIASVHVSSGTNNVRNIVVDSCTVSNAHSLIQIQGGTNGLVVTNCKGINDVHNGINITGGASSFIIMNDTLNVEDRKSVV